METDPSSPIEMQSHRLRATVNDSGPKYNRDGLDTREYLARNGVCGQEPEAAAAHQAVFDAQAELIFAEQEKNDALEEAAELAGAVVDNIKSRLKNELIPNAAQYCGRCIVAAAVCEPFGLEAPDYKSGVFAGLNGHKRKSLHRAQMMEEGVIQPKKRRKLPLKQSA